MRAILWIHQFLRLPLSYDREMSQDPDDPLLYHTPGNAGPLSDFSEAGFVCEEGEGGDGEATGEEDTEIEDPRFSIPKVM